MQLKYITMLLCGSALASEPPKPTFSDEIAKEKKFDRDCNYKSNEYYMCFHENFCCASIVSWDGTGSDMFDSGKWIDTDDENLRGHNKYM